MTALDHIPEGAVIKRKEGGQAQRGEGVSGKRWVKGEGMSRFRPFFRVCAKCGVPLAISGNHTWADQGLILSKDNSQRLIIVETKLVSGMLRKINEKVGEDIEDTLVYAKAFDASRYVRSLMVGWRKVLACYPLARKPFYALLCDQARVLGMADASLLHYRRGKEAVVSCTRCYDKAFFAGDILGAMYAGEGREAAVEINEKNGEIIFNLTVMENECCEAIERFSLLREETLPGYVNHRRCESCGVPFPISFFTWDIGRGLMVDTHNGEAVTLIDVAGMNSAYEDVRARYGDWLDEFLAWEIKVMVDSLMSGVEWKRRRPEEMVRDLFFLAYRGMGNPVFTEATEDGLRARIENPFNYPIVAGIAASFLSRGKQITFDWERPAPGRLELYLHFL